jgi:hypothetical protein
MLSLDAEILFTLVVASVIALWYGFSTVIEASSIADSSIDRRS